MSEIKMDLSGKDKTEGSDIEQTVQIVSAYVSFNPVPLQNVAELIHTVHMTLSQIRTSAHEDAEEPPVKPAVNPKRSVHQDHIVCLEDGQRFVSLKRHLMTSHGMTPEEYRVKWNLPPDYPMVAREYSEKRSQLARELGLGRTRGRKRAASSPKTKK